MSGEPTIYFLGDQALTVEWPQVIDARVHSQCLQLAACMRAQPFDGLRDLCVAYNSVTIFYDALRLPASSYQEARAYLQAAVHSCLQQVQAEETAGRRLRIPVCYEPPYAVDTPALERLTGRAAADLARVHQQRLYRVYMIGFLPGFPYLAETDAVLHVPRKATPVPVQAGSVAIAGRQTGIYPVNAPGGWHVIGRTPLTLFNADSPSPCRLQPGDEVEFYPITAAEFSGWKEELWPS